MIDPIPPLWLAVAVQLHPPPALSAQVAVQPRAEKILPILSHVTDTDDTDMQEVSNGKDMEPLVVVLSAQVPSAFAVHVPVTCKVPVTGTVRQPMPTEYTSILPDNVRQDAPTFQAPTMSPPQGVTLLQLLVVPAWVLPPRPLAPPRFPVLPDSPPPAPEELELQPTLAKIATTETLTKPISSLRTETSESDCRPGCWFVTEIGQSAI